MPVVRSYVISTQRRTLARSDALLISSKDESRAVIEMHPNRPVRERVAHTILIAIVNPGCDKDSLLRQIYIIARITEQLSLRQRIECSTQCLGCSVESIYLGRPGGWSCGAARGRYTKISIRGSSAYLDESTCR
jgi:hypothetical protein